jgi:hypothetical protein
MLPHMRRLVLLALLCGCGDNAAATSPDAPAGETHALGMNDVSILLPLPTALSTPVIATVANNGAPLVDRSWFEYFVILRNDILPKDGRRMHVEDFHVVAIRFDPIQERLRLVAQPIVMDVSGEPGIGAEDVAVHLFYPIPTADLPDVFHELRALARIADSHADAPLAIATIAATNPEYATRLRALLLRYASADRLVRFTVIGQEANSGAFAWHFRGLDHDASGYHSIEIPTISAFQQTALVSGPDVVFDTDFLADDPAGFQLAVNGVLFDAATADQKLQAVEALTAVSNPLLHDADNTQCLACHVATFLAPHRATSIGVDPATVAGRFSSSWPTQVSSVANQDPRVVRAFGWEGNQAAISQAVANATAQVLDVVASHSDW